MWQTKFHIHTQQVKLQFLISNFRCVEAYTTYEFEADSDRNAGT